MPLYEYLCRKCKREFSVAQHLDEYGKKAVRCPHCKGDQVERVIHHMEVVTSKKS